MAAALPRLNDSRLSALDQITRDSFKGLKRTCTTALGCNVADKNIGFAPTVLPLENP